MNYPQVIDYLFNQLANYQKVGQSAYKPGLDTIKSLLSAIGNPEKELKTIHVAGTNGKGSVVHVLSSIFIENGYKTGTFSSPHINRFEERIKINGKLMSEDFVTDFVNTHFDVLNELNPSFFEITTAMAFAYFKSAKTDIAIIETGLGGRLDSTNLILPEISVITNIGLDHTNVLGNTLEAIAVEKAGIIKPNIPVVIGSHQKETTTVFKTKAKDTNSPIYYAEENSTFETDLLGQYQQQNIATSIKTCEILSQNGWHLDPLKTKAALKRVKSNTNFFGRLDLRQTNPKVIFDVAHNPDGVKSLMNEIKLIPHENLYLIYGTSSDKDVDQILDLIPKQAHITFTQFQSQRAKPIHELKILAENKKIFFQTSPTPQLALNAVIQQSNPNDLIVMFGSFFLFEKII